ncbi:MAG: GNAT family N-acetyltransferase [Nostocoides sp.]
MECRHEGHAEIGDPIKPIIDVIDAADSAQASDTRALASVFAEAGQADLGDYASPFSADELATMAGPRQDSDSVTFLARLPVTAEVAGACRVRLPALDNTRVALVELAVVPRHRRAGVGSNLLAQAEHLARQRARTTVLAETSWLAGHEDTHGLEFARSRGYEPAQTVEQNEQDLRHLGWAELTPPAGYAIEVAVGALPEAWLDDRAVLQVRMSTDAPMDDVDMGAEVWDADRMRAEVARSIDMGRTRIEAVARHTATGTLVGFTYVSISAATPRLAYQEDTLVVADHRGQGLGAALKDRVARTVRAVAPQVDTVRTWNAVGNAPMITVNRALGYRTVAYQREWQKRL